MSERYIALDRIDRNLQTIYDYTAGKWSRVVDIPAIELIRCKDCRYSEFKKNSLVNVEIGNCHYYLDTHVVMEYDYCSKGKEKKSNE